MEYGRIHMTQYVFACNKHAVRERERVRARESDREEYVLERERERERVPQRQP